MGLAGEMRNSREVGTGHYFFFFPSLTIFPHAGGRRHDWCSRCGRHDRICDLKKKQFQVEVSRKWMGKENVKPKEKARDGDRVFLIDYLDLIKCLGVR